MRRSNPFVLIAAAWLIVSPMAAQGEDPHLGTWKLKQEKSKPANRAAKPQRVPTVLKIRPVENGHSFVSVLVNGDRQCVRTEYAAKYDGKEYPRTVTTDGKAVSSTVSIRKIDAYTLEHTFRNADGTTIVQISVVPSDGKTRTNTITGTNAQGKKTRVIAVYERLEIF